VTDGQWATFERSAGICDMKTHAAGDAQADVSEDEFIDTITEVSSLSPRVAPVREIATFDFERLTLSTSRQNKGTARKVGS
jgi:hypothetical protein